MRPEENMNNPKANRYPHPNLKLGAFANQNTTQPKMKIRTGVFFSVGLRLPITRSAAPKHPRPAITLVSVLAQNLLTQGTNHSQLPKTKSFSFHGARPQLVTQSEIEAAPSGSTVQGNIAGKQDNCAG